ncbi:MAG TPA: hypothetical protein VEJ87_10700 [Acidimicrobiales bacterium]|nr:hypothetical protein [Acidimicrobiales bacterium]
MRQGLRTRRGLRVLAMFTSVVGLTASLTVAQAAGASTTKKVARYGAGWIAGQIVSNGGYLVSFGSPDVPDTAYSVIGLHAAGVGKTASKDAIAYLETQLSALTTDGTDDPGTLAYFIMAAHAAGVNPRKFGGHAAQNDLVARLLATSTTSGPDAGLFGAQDPTYNGAFRQGLALAALAAVKIPASNPAVAAGITWLENQQCANGLWEAYRSDPSTNPCTPADPDTFTGPDTNSTSLAVQGLAAYGDHPQDGATLSALRSIQSSDAGFPDIAASGQSSDPDSTALVIQTILAEGQDPASSSWAVSGSTPYTALASYQLGCSAPAADRGAFFYPGSSAANVIATVQAVPAAAEKVLPVGPLKTSNAIPTMTC